MCRGRPKKRKDMLPTSSPIKQPTSMPVQTQEARDEAARAFETLPSGFLPSHAVSALCPSDVDPLHEQAVKQASRFEVLSSQDVEALARELRELDERCEYLRKTHRSLRAGRRNLHERVCTYLRSPRMAKFSYECLLKQEEALSELDVSIDGWVSKLEQADNRRIRVRQKLLEHVAATLLMKHPVSMRLDDLRSGTSGVNTPPRSPTSEPLLLDSAVDSSEPKELSLSDVSGLDVGTDDGKKARAQESLEDSEEDKALENILIYADSDVYALLADMEDEMKRFGSESEMVPETTVLSLEEEEEEEEIETEPVSPVFGIADCMSMLRSTTVPVESDLQQLAKSPPAC